MKIIVEENYKKLSITAAHLIKKEVLKNPSLTLGLATGETPIGMYQELIKMNQKGEIDFSEATTFNLDEYLGLPPLHPESYHHYMWKNFFSHINIKKENVFIPQGNPANPKEHCQWYEEKMKEKGGIDLQILGIGRNGHIGFNEPGSSFTSQTRVVNLTETTIKDNARFFDDSEKVPKKAITMGIKTILSADKIMMLASGKNKKKIISEVLNSKPSPKIPASVIKKHNNSILLLDKKAATNKIKN